MRILRTVNRFEIMSRVLFNRNELLLLNFQKRSLLNSEEGDTSSGIDVDDDQKSVESLVSIVYL